MSILRERHWGRHQKRPRDFWQALIFTRTYIKATADRRPVGGGRPSPFWAAADRAKTSQGWRYREIDTDHMIMVNKPADLVALLLELT